MDNLLCFSLRLSQLSVGLFLVIQSGKTGWLIAYIQQRLDARGVLGRLGQIVSLCSLSAAFLALSRGYSYHFELIYKKTLNSKSRVSLKGEVIRRMLLRGMLRTLTSGTAWGFNQLGIYSAILHRLDMVLQILHRGFLKGKSKKFKTPGFYVIHSFQSLVIKMSRASKLTLAATSIGTAGIVYFVHWSQEADKAVCFPSPIMF